MSGGGFDPSDFELEREFDLSVADVNVDLAEEVNVDLSKLSNTEVSELETAIAARQVRIAELQHNVVTAKTERDELSARVDALTTRNAELAGELEAARVDRIDLDGRDLIGEFGTALDDAEETLSAAGFGVADVRVDVKTGVVATEGGLKFHLPGVDESPRADLSTVSFGLRSRATAPELAYDRVPSVVGLELGEAEAVLARAGFEAVVAGGDSEASGTPVVVDQFPSGRAVAEPGSPVELAVEYREESGRDHAGHDHDADESAGTTANVGALPVESVRDVGPTFGGRLREAGIETVSDLAAATADRLAAVADTSVTRAEHWVDHANALLAGDATGGDAGVVTDAADDGDDDS